MGGGERYAPAVLTPGNDPVRIIEGEEWTSGPVSSPPEFEPRTVQPRASRYTDWAIMADKFSITESLKYI